MSVRIAERGESMATPATMTEVIRRGLAKGAVSHSLKGYRRGGRRMTRPLPSGIRTHSHRRGLGRTWARVGDCEGQIIIPHRRKIMTRPNTIKLDSKPRRQAKKKPLNQWL